MSETVLQNGGSLFFLALVLVFMLPAIGIIRKALVVVPSDRAFVVERFGRFLKVLPAGLHFVPPFIDRVSRDFSLIDEEVLIPEQRCIASGGESVIVAGKMLIAIVEPRLAAYEVSDPAFAILQLFQLAVVEETSLVPGQVIVDGTIGLAQKVGTLIAPTALGWGVRVGEIELSARWASSAVA